MGSTRMPVRARAGQKAGGRRSSRTSRLGSLEDPWTLAEFVRNVEEGVYITTTDGAILDANPAFLHMFGVRSVRELANYTVEQLQVDPQRRQEELALLATAGSVRDFELELRRPDGEVRTVLDTAHQVTDARSGETLYHGILIDISDRKQLERELLQAALRDPLTGCYNRRFLTNYEPELKGENSGWGVVIIDIDHFKEYNDLYDHHTGDLVLRRVSRFLMSVVRAEDAVVRIGGDEFLLLLADGSASSTEEVARRLRERGRRALPVALSDGWAVRKGAENLGATIRRADHQLIRQRAQERRRPKPRRGPSRLPRG
jgi:diguanylate cyclase (GGDEF)-like protein/PAS domain S-box-containing protein